MTGREIIEAILKDARNLDSQILCGVVCYNSEGWVVDEQSGVNYTIVGGKLTVDTRRQ